MKINNSIYSVMVLGLINLLYQILKDKRWGDLKVSGKIDNFKIKNKNLGPMKNR
jgi:hypothetical protein